ncbi:endo-1,4-beta-xylanase [Sesbania bispinosa]|nr:endo-1,4-beta-xylanase [Sesbania bispinosa]
MEKENGEATGLKEELRANEELISVGASYRRRRRTGQSWNEDKLNTHGRLQRTKKNITANYMKN